MTELVIIELTRPSIGAFTYSLQDVNQQQTMVSPPGDKSGKSTCRLPVLGCSFHALHSLVDIPWLSPTKPCTLTRRITKLMGAR